jgi:hypothetical protein
MSKRPFTTPTNTPEYRCGTPIKGTNILIWLTITGITFVVLFFLMTSCSPSAKLRRAEKLINKAEQAGLQWHSDTLHSTIEIPIPEIVKDTIFQSKPGDTVFIHKERLSIKYVHLKGDSVFIEGKCDADTVYKEVIVRINKSIECQPEPQKIKWWYLVIALFVGGIIVKLLR